MLQNNLKLKLEMIKQAKKTLLKRYQILINSTSLEIQYLFLIDMMRKAFVKYLQRFEQLSYDVIMFQKLALQLMGQNVFEAFSNDKDGRRRFKYREDDLEITIDKNIASIIKALTHSITIKPYTKQHVIDQAVSNIKKNYLITKLIAGKEFTRQKLDEFLTQQQYKVFDYPHHEYMEFIQGLSSYDGKIVYIHESYDYNYEKQYVEPDKEIERISKELLNSPYLALIWLIEYQLMENLSRWSSNSHILSISPERNQNLRIENDQMIGSGNFYLSKAHKYKNKQHNPFQLNYKLLIIMMSLVYEY